MGCPLLNYRFIYWTLAFLKTNSIAQKNAHFFVVFSKEIFQQKSRWIVRTDVGDPLISQKNTWKTRFRPQFDMCSVVLQPEIKNKKQNDSTPKKWCCNKSLMEKCPKQIKRVFKKNNNIKKNMCCNTVDASEIQTKEKHVRVELTPKVHGFDLFSPRRKITPPQSIPGSAGEAREARENGRSA